MRRRLFLDIETSPNIGTFWSAGYDQRIEYDNIIQERAIICICYKWEGEKAVSSLEWDGKKGDKKLIQKIIEVMSKSDEIVMHNGDLFDLPWIRTRAVLYGMDMPQYKTIDTLKIARKSFRFNSNRLDYLGRYLGLGQKIKTDYNLWKDVVLKNDRTALGKMVKYCKQDVLLLELVFNKLKNHISPGTHYGMMMGKDRGSCPECGSDNLKISNYRITAAGAKKVCMQCGDCGKYHQKPYKDVKDRRPSESRPRPKRGKRA